MTIIFIAIIFFSRNTLLKLFISLESKCISYSLVYVSAPLRQANKTYTSLHRAMSTTKLADGNTSRSDSFLKTQEFQCVSESISICEALPNKRAYRNSSEDLEGMLLDWVTNESTIVDFFSFCLRDRLTGSIYFVTILYARAIYWACTGKWYGVEGAWFIIYIFCNRCPHLCSTKFMVLNQLTDSQIIAAFLSVTLFCLKCCIEIHSS